MEADRADIEQAAERVTRARETALRARELMGMLQ